MNLRSKASATTIFNTVAAHFQCYPSKLFCVHILKLATHRLQQGRNQLFVSGVEIFFIVMTSPCFFNRGTTFSQTVTDEVLFATFPKMRTIQF